MPALLSTVLAYSLLPATAMLVGACVVLLRTPSPSVRSALQHFAAGVVFAAVAVELLPDVVHERAPLAVVLGFALGVATMLTVRWLLEPTEGDTGGESRVIANLVLAVGVDLLIDGLLIGIGFAAGAREGLMLTIALTLEVLFLGMSTSASLRAAGATRTRAIFTIAMLAVALLLGATVGATVLAGMSGSALEVVLSFGLAALLYLVTEELLVEAHEVAETPAITAMFFVGFLVLLVMDMIAAS